MDTFETLRMTVLTALMAALIAAGAFLIIPVGPVPIVLQNLFVMVAGLILAPRWAAGAVGIYLLAGSLGLPVFAGGSGGIGRLLGPTGGYLVGYLPAVVVISWTHSRIGRQPWLEIGALVLAAAMVYALGVCWLKTVTAMSWTGAVAAGMLPFLPGDVLKIAAALPIARTLRPIVEGRVGVKLET
ncbi:MAG: biotin transporter BioY [Desulfobacteraceae bacterium]|jgi:biotin transport system substrate-specific component|nr:biotin transporter BioY [Desulfobacteraceae bacterium]